MHHNRLQCPHCAAVLRIRDRKHVGRQVDCPDCGEPILVLADGPHALQLVMPDSQAAPAPATASRGTRTLVAPPPAVAPAKPARWQQWAGSLTTATGLAWSVAAAAALLLLVLAWPFGAASSTGPPQQAANGDAPRAAGDEEGAPSGVAGRQPEEVGGDDLRARMEQLGRQMMTFVDEHERFPASPSAGGGLTEGERLSWLAELVADNDAKAGLHPQWDQAWRDPLNDRFVRRAFPQLLNPGVQQLTGPDRYPATHFVGIAGVGQDGPRLPAGHPRAGVFGVNRRTRIADVKDGLSNTMMIAGVTSNVGGWAASGPATMRPLTAEPYVNGPDGFGTGEKQGMSVLMADGSVRFLSADTDPRLMRRMAAMADGLPLDANVPGEPGDPRPPTEPEPGDQPLAKADEPQPDDEPEPLPAGPAVIAPEPPRVIDVAKLLSQKILEYEHQQSAPLRVILTEVEEMAGVPIRVDQDQVGNDLLEKATSVRRLKETTVGEILQALLEQAGLGFVIEADGIRVEAVERPQAQ